ncbi:unnamed protein product, partial [Ectocarpus fasciculatus]
QPYISIFIPAYNVESHLAQVIRRLPSDALERIKSIHIINDGSKDKTSEVAEQLVKSNKQISLLCLKDESEVIVCLHGDGQYSPEYIMRLVEKVQEFDIVQGSRHAHGTALEGGMPLYKYIAGKVLTWLENLAFGLNQTDYHSGYLAYSSKTLKVLPINKLSNSFDFDLELIACARSNGLRIGEVGIPTRYADEESNLNPINYGLRVLRVIFRYLIGYYA